MPARRRRRSSSRRSSSRRSSSRRSPSRRRTRSQVKLHLLPGSRVGPQGPTEAGHILDASRKQDFKVDVTLARNKFARKSSEAFVACATFGRTQACVKSHAPQRAIGKALKKLGSMRDVRHAHAFGSLAGGRRRRRR